MGLTPIPIAQREDFEKVGLRIAREAYARGDIGIEELEAAIDHVFRGGRLTPHGRPRPSAAKPAEPTWVTR